MSRTSVIDAPRLLATQAIYHAAGADQIRSLPVTTKLGTAHCRIHLENSAATGMLSRHGSIRFDISSSNFETIVQHLRSGAVDVAAGFDAAFNEWADLQRQPMGSLKSTLFVRKDHLLLAKKKIVEKDLADYEIIARAMARRGHNAALEGVAPHLEDGGDGGRGNLQPREYGWSLDLGYNCPANFSTMFKRVLGAPPRRYQS